MIPERHCLHARWPTHARTDRDCPDCGASREPRPALRGAVALLDRRIADLRARWEAGSGTERAEVGPVLRELEAFRAELVGGGAS